MAFKQRHKGGEGLHHANILEERAPGKRNNRCKILEKWMTCLPKEQEGSLIPTVGKGSIGGGEARCNVEQSCDATLLNLLKKAEICGG